MCWVVCRLVYDSCVGYCGLCIRLFGCCLFGYEVVLLGGFVIVCFVGIYCVLVGFLFDSGVLVVGSCWFVLIVMRLLFGLSILWWLLFQLL